jgi:hypothetical protein
MRLFTEGPASDKLFIKYRDEAWLSEGREIIESLWNVYKEYCPDDHFLSEVRHQFHQRTWEMFLACSLIESGHELHKSRTEGPDICIVSAPPIWIEAISVNAGTGEDRVPTDDERLDPGWPQEDGLRVISPPTEESVILRCTQALQAKSQQISQWKLNGIVPAGDPCLVAISLGAVEGADFFTYGTDLPVFFKAFFGFGGLYYNPGATGRKYGYESRARIAKASGDMISARAFLDGGARDISGVICSGRGVFNMRESPSDLIFIHNPTALYPVGLGAIRVGQEWLVEDNRLKRVDNL